ncbi:activator-dependent family glycosyltransferase [Streptomyces ardesiacus]|uniref:activator-dependent family glycosyltransferase n=1 Tax=Streptomyces ardesiacus TaxID=285564 RepID=UPI00365BF96B
MRVLFTVFAVKTHMYNLVPLAWALRAAGHEVCVASHPDLAEAITRTGLTAVPVGDPLSMGGAGKGPTTQTFQGVSGSMVEDPSDDPSWERVLGTFTVACSVQYEYLAGLQVMDDLVEFAQAWQPDLVVWDALTFTGAVAARACGAAHARMLFGMDYVARMYGRYTELLAAQPPERREDPVTEWTAGRLARYGVKSGPEDTLEMLTGQWTIDPTPSWMQFRLPLPYLPVRLVPFNGPTTAPDWVREPAARPRVCLSLGMSGRDQLGGDLLSIGGLLDALADFDIELVATLDSRQLAGTSALPDNVRPVDFVPLNDLLPTCAAAIHHGGFGTVGSVLTHGVPSITIPAPWWDETDLGRRIAARGAGFLMDPHRPDLDALRDHLRRLLDDPSFTARAADVRADLLATPSPHDLVPELERRARSYRTRQGDR